MSRDYTLKEAPRATHPIPEVAVRPPLSHLLDSARRELAARRALYPHYVHDGRMTVKAAQHELACQAELVRHLEMLVEVNESFTTVPEIPGQMGPIHPFPPALK